MESIFYSLYKTYSIICITINSFTFNNNNKEITGQNELIYKLITEGNNITINGYNKMYKTVPRLTNNNRRRPRL